MYEIYCIAFIRIIKYELLFIIIHFIARITTSLYLFQTWLDHSKITTGYNF